MITELVKILLCTAPLAGMPQIDTCSDSDGGQVAYSETLQSPGPVCPQLVTEWYRSLRIDASGNSSTEVKKRLPGGVPAGKFAQLTCEPAP